MAIQTFTDRRDRPLTAGSDSNASSAGKNVSTWRRDGDIPESGLTNFLFDPDYPRNGVFYTIHMEDPSLTAPAAPRAGSVPGLDLSGYTVTPAIMTPTVEDRIERDVVLIGWTDRNLTNATFEGTARELMRVEHPLPQHPLGEMTFNPVARPWRCGLACSHARGETVEGSRGTALEAGSRAERIRGTLCRFPTNGIVIGG